MWLWSRNSECGSVTAARRMLASPPRAIQDGAEFRVAGAPGRLRPPNSRVVSFGRNGSRSQPLVWNGTLTAKALKAAGLAGIGAAARSAPAC